MLRTFVKGQVLEFLPSLPFLSAGFVSFGCAIGLTLTLHRSAKISVKFKMDAEAKRSYTKIIEDDFEQNNKQKAREMKTKVTFNVIIN